MRQLVESGTCFGRAPLHPIIDDRFRHCRRSFLLWWRGRFFVALDLDRSTAF